MSMVDGVLFDTQIATATLTALAAVTTGDDTVRMLPNPRLIDCVFHAANGIYGTFHQAEAFPGMVDPALYIPAQLSTTLPPGGGKPPFGPTPLIGGSKFYVKGYQDSGGNQDVNCIASILYDSPGEVVPLEQAKTMGIAQGDLLSGTPTANTWEQIDTFVGDTRHRYIILGINSLSATGSAARAIRFRHPSFGALLPTLRATSVAEGGTAFFPLCPVFDGGDTLKCEAYNSSNEQTDVVLLMKRL